MCAKTPEWALRVVDAAPDGIVVVDDEGTVVEINVAAERMLGRSREEAIGRPVAELTRSDDPRVAAWEVLDEPVTVAGRGEDGEELALELTVVRAGGEPALRTGFIRRAGVPAAAAMGELLAAAEKLARLGSWRMDLRTGEATWSDELYRIHGVEPGQEEPGVEMLLAFVHPEDREHIATLLATVVEEPDQIPARGVTTDYRAVLPDGSVREIRFFGRIERDAQGALARWIGSAQDVTDERMTERELRAHYAVSQALRDWESFDEGVVGLLRRLGTALQLQLGKLWTQTGDGGRLTCRAVWRAPDVDAGDLEPGLTVRPGEGLAGQAWLEREPVMAERVSPAEPPAQAGVCSGFAFPALPDDEPLAALVFYSLDRREPSDRLRRTLTGIGRELGRFLARRRAQLDASPLSERELEVLHLAAEGNSGPAIAEQLVVSPSTVKTHFEHIYEKLGVGDRAAAVAHALRTGLIH